MSDDTKMFRLPRSLRTQLKQARDDGDYDNLSDLLDDLIPDDGLRLEIPESDMVVMSVESDVHEKIHRLTGDNISAYETIAHYAFGESTADLSIKQKTGEINNE